MQYIISFQESWTIYLININYLKHHMNQMLKKFISKNSDDKIFKEITLLGVVK